ncbi:hypothetical protein PV08_00688 [Exophiala spinifera]|uniref:NCS1 nucleoside transporter n=1 Tax=Exophiala spinifera TaxID=91928 RepID=A0A0D2BMF3_9EURO|nr:uncharacterized protein PV08_00688 [Exophiala spinifera]KIW20113.1 hypothetical protein PV08_00688 [Exophiala spinifera]
MEDERLDVSLLSVGVADAKPDMMPTNSFYWMSDALAGGSWSTGASLITLGFTARTAIPIAFCSYFLVSIPSALTGRIGTFTHTPFPVNIRASFGPWGSVVPILARMIIGLIWMFVQTYLGGTYVTILLSGIWPSYNRIPNRLPASAGIESKELLSVFIFWCIQVRLTTCMSGKLRYLFLVKAIIVPICYFGIFIWAMIATNGGDTPYIRGRSTGSGWAVLQAINALAGGASAVETNAADFSRYMKHGSGNFWQILWIPITNTLPIVVATLATGAAQAKYGVYEWNAADLFLLWNNRAAQVFCAAAFILSNIGINISANAVAFSNDMTSLCPRYFNNFRSSALCAILSFAACPWLIVQNAPALLNFLGSYACFLSGIAAIMIADFYLVRKGRVDMREYYNFPGGIYWYWFGFNWRAIAAWVISFAPNLPGLIHGVNAKVPNVQPYTYYFSWLFGTAVSVALYMLINYFFPPKASLINYTLYEDDMIVSETNDVEAAAATELRRESVTEKQGAEETVVVPVPVIKD